MKLYIRNLKDLHLKPVFTLLTLPQIQSVFFLFFFLSKKVVLNMGLKISDVQI